MSNALRRAGRDVAMAAAGFWVIFAVVFLAGRWYLPSGFTRGLIESAAAAATPTGGSSDSVSARIQLMSDQLGALDGPGAVVAISGVIEIDEILDSAESLVDLCLGCLDEITGGGPDGTRLGEPVQVAVRFWEGTTVLSITADATEVGTPRTEDLRVTLNAGGRVFFGRQCTLTLHHSEQVVYSGAIAGGDLYELRGFDGVLECAEVTNPTSGDTVTVLAVFSYRVPSTDH